MSSPDQPVLGGRLLQRASRAALWNTLFLPLLGLTSLLFSVLIRRRFGLLSGVYDVAMGLAGAVQRNTNFGIPGNLPKFLPEVSATSGPPGVRQFLRHVTVLRLGLLGVLVVPLNLFAGPIAEEMGLGADGPLYIWLITALVAARAVMNLMVATLNSFFAQFWTNLLGLVDSVLKLALVGAVLLLGYGMGGVLGAITASAVVVALALVVCVSIMLHDLSVADHGTPSTPDAGGRWFAGQGARFLRFNGLIFLSGFLHFFGRMGFIAPGLALVTGTADVALFATAFNLTFTTMNLAITGFRGLYKPIFARLRIRNDAEQLRRAFSLVTKGQLVVLVPAGVGLVVLSADYIPLLFGDEFRPAVHVAWVLVGMMYASTALNLPEIMLTVDERYREIFLTQSIQVIAAPLFLWAGGTSGLVAAAAVLGSGRLLSAVAAYVVCRQLYAVRLPWAFAARVGFVGVIMGLALASLRLVLGGSLIQTVALTALGVVIYALGLRVTKALGPQETDLLKRSGLPGSKHLVTLLTPPSRA